LHYDSEVTRLAVGQLCGSAYYLLRRRRSLSEAAAARQGRDQRNAELQCRIEALRFEKLEDSAPQR
jgi:hypothetical protein